MCCRLKRRALDLLDYDGLLRLNLPVYCNHRELNCSAFCGLRLRYNLVIFFDFLDLLDLLCEHFVILRRCLGLDAGGFGRHFIDWRFFFNFFNERCLPSGFFDLVSLNFGVGFLDLFCLPFHLFDLVLHLLCFLDCLFLLPFFVSDRLYFFH